ncbi:hypothetical protein BN2476_270009 [Paraburkholderia piptadeniae]|uniref:Uncharacterized protein n=1 Tax=Paraburkholderia piptadeniae TaxID=1701573 RepID=A0A1N7S1F7_9BURK|nr:hypothetical protein BN2476_270009 [Paraburkholderia piptadeniae]
MAAKVELLLEVLANTALARGRSGFIERSFTYQPCFVRSPALFIMSVMNRLLSITIRS